MLNEFERWQTFTSSNWPYEDNRLSQRELSMDGFYYTGTMDNTICAFCDLSLHDWKQGDIPFIQHLESQPTCPHLTNHPNL